MKRKRVCRLLAVASVIVTATVATSKLCLAGSFIVQRQASLSGTRNFGPIPKFAHGYLVAWGLESGTITTYDSRGDLVTETTLKLPDVARLLIGDAAAAPDGTVAVRASAYSARGQYAAYLIWLNRSGSIVRAVRTSPYQAFQIAFDSGGALWTVGRVHDSEYNATPVHDILRRYDAGGRLIRTGLPNTTMTPAPRRRHPAEECRFVELQDRMGMYCRQAHEWIEFSREGELSHRRRLQPLPEGVTVFGAAALANGQVFLSSQRTSTEGRVENGTSRAWYRVNRTDGSLTAVEAPGNAKGKPIGPIIGAADSQLVTLADREMLWVGVH